MFPFIIDRYNRIQLAGSTSRRMLSDFTPKNALFAVSLLALVACGGGGGGGGGAATGGGATNSAPIANAGADQTVLQRSRVTLDGTGSSDPDGDSLTYTWTQTGGPTVAITNSRSPTAGFDAPEIAGGTGTPPAVNVSGKVSYEFVPPRVQGNNRCAGLDFANTEPRPIRAATVQLIEAGETLTFQLAVNDGTATVTDTVDIDFTGAVLGTTVASDTGNYAFNNIEGARDVRLRVRAELKRSGSPSWNVEVRDNVDTSSSPLPLFSRPLYVVDSNAFNTGDADVTRDLTATTGWDGSSYTGPRAAAPFAILDAIYSGMKLVLSADPAADFGPMDAFWSVNNTLTGQTDINAGELSTSFYRGDLDALFLLGDADVDTEEFDDHVTVHEWGHYFEDVFSRSDSIGGSHAGGQSLDARLAFGEGWATALAAMALDEPQYCDTGEAGASSGFGIDTENYNIGPQGWFNEMSVATFLYDLWDTDVDGSDTSSIGFGPIFDTMAGPQRNTPAFTTLFSFAADLRPMLNAQQLAFVDTELARENVDTTGIDIWGNSQDRILTSPNQARDVLPLYTTLPTDGTVINICANSDYDFRSDGNKLAEYRYLRMDVAQPQSYDIVVNTVSADGAAPSQPAPGFDCVQAYDNNPDDPLVHTYSDPDFRLFSSGTQISESLSCTPNREETTGLLLDPGIYVVALTEYRFADEDTVAGYPGSVCLEVTATPN